MNKWVKWSKTHVMAELLLVPRVTQQTIETLKAEFHTIAASFRSERQAACKDLLQKLKTMQADGDAKSCAERRQLWGMIKNFKKCSTIQNDLKPNRINLIEIKPLRYFCLTDVISAIDKHSKHKEI